MASSRTHKNSVTYLVQGEHGGPIKIGLSNPTGLGSRLASLQTGYPYRLVVVRLEEGNYEAELHHRFAHLRLHGEWFSPGEDLLAFCGPDVKGDQSSDFRAGFEAGWGAAITEAEQRMRYVVECLDDGCTRSKALEGVLQVAAVSS